ncbi:MAG: serine/threonine-protein kinase [Planctomycetota bacterium]|mgnify:FL=1
MNPDGPSQNDSLAESPREQRLGELINEYFDSRERGDNISQDEFLAKYPEYAEELRGHLAGLDLITDLGSSMSETLPGHWTPNPKGSSAVDPLAAANAPLPVIPGYDVHKQIGRGGMGIVYKALQVSTKRVVALKLLLEGPFASDMARKRFEREIALSAALKHPNIIPIYDSGTVDGRMYYAMEHIFGMSLGDHLRANKSDLRQRLQSFVKICGAVGHAHQRGVIHRDLKPTNILVDGTGEPHVLDFGLAKAGMFGDMTTSITAQIIGTPAYMSPEQASGDPSGIDIRTDVYALGVMLYEMLTGEMPYDTNVSMGKILHNIAQAEPKPPSKINPKIDGDLSAILLKALEKSKDARYQSVDSFASDVQHYLAGEPISAKPPSAMYLLKKVLFKHKLVAGAVVFALIAGVTGFLVLGQFKKEQARTLAVKEDKVREAVERNKLLEDQLLAKQVGDEKARVEREQNERALKLALSNLSPEQRETYKPLLDLTSGLAAGESAAPMLLDLLGKGMSGLAPASSEDSPKKEVYDPNQAERSGKPKDTGSESSAAQSLQDTARRLMAGAGEVGKVLVPGLADIGKTPTTTQPAPTTPVEQQGPTLSKQQIYQQIDQLLRQLEQAERSSATSQPASAPATSQPTSAPAKP